jgi:hypothetical protein
MELTKKGAMRKLRHAFDHLIELDQIHYAQALHPHSWDCDCSACMSQLETCTDCAAGIDASMILINASDRIGLPEINVVCGRI